MAGLLDLINSPAGIGLLSAVAGGFAGARRGTPLNNIGRGAVAGLSGYASAQDQLKQDSDNKLTQQLRQMQVEQIQQTLANQKGMRDSLQSLYKPAGAAPYQADNPFGEDLGTLQNETPATFGGKPVDPVMAAVLPYAQPDDIMKMVQKQNNPSEQFGKIMPHSYTPESLAAYQKSGNYADLKPISAAEFGKVNPGQFTPESLAKYAETGQYGDLVQFRSPTQIDQGGYKTLYDPGTGRTQSYGVTPKITDTPDYQAAQESAKATAKAGVEKTTANTAKQTKATNVLDLITQAEGVIDKASGSKAGALLNYGKQAVGVSDEKTQANQQLKLISGWMVSNVPRMEGPQSNFDVQNYREMAGMVGDESIPIADRKAALKQLRELQGRYADNGAPMDTEQQFIQQRRASGVPDSQIAKEMTANARKASKPAATFDLPPNAKQYEGKTLRDTKSGKRFQSVGGKWVQVQ